jgi:hypothetical protein
MTPHNDPSTVFCKLGEGREGLTPFSMSEHNTYTF